MENRLVQVAEGFNPGQESTVRASELEAAALELGWSCERRVHAPDQPWSSSYPDNAIVVFHPLDPNEKAIEGFRAIRGPKAVLLPRTPPWKSFRGWHPPAAAHLKARAEYCARMGREFDGRVAAESADALARFAGKQGGWYWKRDLTQRWPVFRAVELSKKAQGAEVQLLAVGELEPSERPDLVLLALRHLLDLGIPARLTWIGGQGTPGGYQRYVGQLTGRLRLADHVSWKPPADEARLWSHYRFADYFVSASEDESSLERLRWAIRGGCVPVCRDPKRGSWSFFSEVSRTILSTFGDPASYRKAFEASRDALQASDQGGLDGVAFLKEISREGPKP